MPRSVSELVESLVDRVQMAAESATAGDIELATGIESLDLAIGGLRAGDLTLLTGPPGCGKSSLATSIIRHTVLDAGCPALLASLQTKGENALIKMISNGSAIPLRTLGTGKLTDQEWLTFSDVVGRLWGAPLMVCDAPVQTTQSIEAEVLASVERYGRCAVVAIDHSQLLQPISERGANWASALRERCCELKLMARRRDCAVLLVDSSKSQGSLVEMIPEADVILELRRTGAFDAAHREERCEIRVLKQQMGSPCTVLVRFEAASASFRSHS